MTARQALLVIGLVALVAAEAAEAAAEPSVRLFRQAPSPAGALRHQAALAEYDVEPAAERLARAAGLVLDLPDGSVLEVRRTGLQERGKGDLSWQGKGGGSDAAFAVKGRSLAGVVFGPGGTWEIVPGPRGRHRLVQVDEGRFAPCADPPTPPLDRWDEAAGDAAAFAPGDGDASTRIDVLVVYTTAAKNAAGGTSGIQATIQSAVDVTNTAYANSQVSPRMRLVHTAEVAYTESGNISTDLDWVTANPAVARLRNAYAADMVSLVVDNGGGYCGVGWLQWRSSLGPGFASSAFQITARDCAAANITLAHEFGHNQGAEHDPANANPPSSASYDWAFGHFHDLGAANGYRTVMSYATPCGVGCPRVPYFSNPNVTYKGLATGVGGQRENYRTLNSTAPWVSNFRRRGLLADLSSDNKADILWYHQPSGSLHVWNMNGTTSSGGTSAGQLADGGWRIAGVRDFNDDGEADVLWHNVSNGAIYVWTMSGATKTGGALVGQVSDTGWRIVGTGDFNGDKQADVLWHHATSGTVYLWTMRGTTQLGGNVVGQATLDWKVIGVGDFSDDGKADILWQNQTSGSLYVWFMNGTAQSGGAAAGGVADGNWKAVGVADFNGDARADVLWRHGPTGTVHVWTMNGTTASGGATVGQVPDANWAIVAPR